MGKTYNKEKKKEYYQRNKVKILQQHKENYSKNKEVIKAKSKKYRLKNKEKIREFKKKYYAKNIDKIKEKRKGYGKKYYWKNKEMIRKKSQTPKGIWCGLKNRSREKNLEEPLSFNKFEEWYNAEPKICSYCKIKENELKDYPIHQTKKRVTRLTIDRKDNNKGYIEGNLAFACSLCNTLKNSFFTYEEMLQIGKTIEKKRRIK